METFRVDSVTGSVRLMSPLDYFTQSHYHLIVIVEVLDVLD